MAAGGIVIIGLFCRCYHLQHLHDGHDTIQSGADVLLQPMTIPAGEFLRMLFHSFKCYYVCMVATTERKVVHLIR